MVRIVAGRQPGPNPMSRLPGGRRVAPKKAPNKAPKGPKAYPGKGKGVPPLTPQQVATLMTNREYNPAIADISLQTKQAQGNQASAMQDLAGWGQQEQAQNTQGAAATNTAYNTAVQGSQGDNVNIANLFGGSTGAESAAYGGVGTDLLRAQQASGQEFSNNMTPILAAQVMDYQRRAKAGFHQDIQTLNQKKSQLVAAKGAAFGDNYLKAQSAQLDQLKYETDAHYKAAAIAYQAGNTVRYQQELALAQQKEQRYEAAQQGVTPGGGLLPGFHRDPTGRTLPNGWRVGANGQPVKVKSPTGAGSVKPSVTDTPKRVRMKVAADAKSYWIGSGKNRRRPTYSEGFSYLYQKYRGYIGSGYTEAALDKMIDNT